MTHHQLARLMATKKTKSFEPECARYTARQRQRGGALQTDVAFHHLFLHVLFIGKACIVETVKKGNMMKWGGNEERSRGGGSCAQICPISFSGEMSLRSFTTGSECSINCERLILSALNYKRQQQIIFDGEEGVCHGQTIYHQSKRHIL